MPRVRVLFSHAVQDSQDYSTFDGREDHVVSTLYFALEFDGKRCENMRVEVRRPYGTNFEEEPLEVGRPIGECPYLETWNHSAFAEVCERYFRSCVGAAGRGIHISGGASNISMRNLTFKFPWVAEFEIPDAKSPAW